TRAIDAFDILRTEDVADAAAQIGLRTAEGEAVAEAADGQRISAAAEGEGTLADGTADDPARLDEGDAHSAGVGACGGEAGKKKRCKRDEDGAEMGHALSFCMGWNVRSMTGGR